MWFRYAPTPEFAILLKHTNLATASSEVKVGSVKVPQELPPAGKGRKQRSENTDAFTLVVCSALAQLEGPQEPEDA